MNWQPIETAPIKPFDRERWFYSATPRLLLYYGSVVIGSYSYTQKAKGRWKTDGITINPTHWMPLPEQPL